MIFKGQNELSPEVIVEVDGVSVDYKTIHSINISLEENKHDVVVIQLNGIPPKAITDYIDASVRISASIGPGRTLDFCGYVMYVEPESISSSSLINNSIFQKAKVVCFGASVSMKSTRTRIWENVSSVSLARTLAEDHGFSLDVIKDQFVIPKIMQTKQSDWEFISEFCKKYGYSITVHGTHMRLWDISKSIGRQQSFEMLSAPIKNNTVQPGFILRFVGTFGYLTPDGSSYNYTVESIDETGKLVKTNSKSVEAGQSWSGATPTTRYNSYLSASSNSVYESEKIIEANFKTKLPFNAMVETVSALGTIPGGVVAISGYDSKFEGFWYVKAVEHEIVGSNCLSKLRIAKDFNTTNLSTYRPTQQGSIPPKPRFINKSWKASVERVEMYV